MHPISIAIAAVKLATKLIGIGGLSVLWFISGAA